MSNPRYNSIKSNRKVVASAGTAVALGGDVPCQKIEIMAETDNTDYVVVGGSDVVAALATRKGIPLIAGQSITLYVNNLSKVYLDAIVNTEGVTYTYYD